MTKLWAALNVFGLVCGVLGGVLLFRSLTATSSNYRLVERSDHGVAICLNDRVVETGFGGPLILTQEPCPKGIGPSVASVISAEKPQYVPCGLALVFIGLALQLPAAFVTFFEK